MAGNNITINSNNIWNSNQTGNPATINGQNNLYGGNFGLNNQEESGNPIIEMKRKLAGKQAMKLIGDAWDIDKKRANAIDEMSELKAEKVKELNELNKKLTEIEDRKSALQEEYGVSSDSQEQKDLELLEKYQDNKNGASFDDFSEEEIERLKELQHTERTEYQSRVLELNNVKDVYSLEKNKLEYAIKKLTEAITDSGLEQLKSQDMLNASDAAEQITEAANKEILGLLIQEGKDNIDETTEEAQEKAEETEEKQEEFEERIEEAKENRKDQEELIEGAAETDKLEADIQVSHKTDSAVAEAQRQIQLVLKENNLINEDIKGIEIDLGF